MAGETYDSGNVFAKILRGEIPSAKILETDDMLAIMDAMPQSRGHCLVIPKAPSRNILDASDETLAKVLPLLAVLARGVVKAFGADGAVISQFNEAVAGQTVFHLHFHVVPRYEGVALEKHAAGMADADELAADAKALRAALAL